MAFRINTNITAQQAYGALSFNQASSSNSLQKLSTGLRINKAADDAAGLGISEGMSAQVRGLQQATRNSQDAVSLVQTAEGGMGTIQSVLQRMRELAVQSANGTYTTTDRSNMQTELTQLKEEVSQISKTTQFNTMSLLDAGNAKAVSDVFTSMVITSALTAPNNSVGTTTGFFAAGNKLVTVGASALQISGDNGDSWTSINISSAFSTSSGFAAKISSITGRADFLVAAGTDNSGMGVAYTSNNGGASWSQITTVSTNTAGSTLNVTQANGMFVAYGADNTVGATKSKLFSSMDGVTWTTQTAQASALINGIANVFGDGTKLYIVGEACAGVGGVTASAEIYTASMGVATMAQALTSMAASFTIGILSAGFVSINAITYNQSAGAFYVAGTFSQTAGSGNIKGVFSLATLYGAGNTVVSLSTGSVLSLSSRGSETVAAMDNNSIARLASGAWTTASAMVGSMAVTSGNVTSVAGAQGFNFYNSASNTDYALEQSAEVYSQDFQMQVGANNGVNFQMQVTVRNTGLSALNLQSVAIGNQSMAMSSITTINDAINTISQERARIGAQQNRLDYAIANLASGNENTQAARSNIRDVDMAGEMMTFSKYNILTQAATAMLAQANQQPQQVLSLLR